MNRRARKVSWSSDPVKAPSLLESSRSRLDMVTARGGTRKARLALLQPPDAVAEDQSTEPMGRRWRSPEPETYGKPFSGLLGAAWEARGGYGQTRAALPVSAAITGSLFCWVAE